MSHDLLFKLLLIGDSNVGKICLLRRFTENESDAPNKSTIGVDFKIKTVELEGKKIKLQIWDTAGQERFHTITTSYYRGAVGIFDVYDITNLKSFENVTNWLRNIAEHASEHAEKMILGNNCEKVTERQVSVEQAQHLAIEHACQFLEVSAKEDINVEKAFLSLTSAILNKYRQTICPTKIKPSFCKT